MKATQMVVVILVMMMEEEEEQQVVHKAVYDSMQKKKNITRTHNGFIKLPDEKILKILFDDFIHDFGRKHVHFEKNQMAKNIKSIEKIQCTYQ